VKDEYHFTANDTYAILNIGYRFILNGELLPYIVMKHKEVNCLYHVKKGYILVLRDRAAGLTPFNDDYRQEPF